MQFFNLITSNALFIFQTCIGEFLQTLTDPDLNVRRVALVTFNSAAHNKPSIVKTDVLVTVLPHVYAETKIRKDLIREVEMGPFKHTVDDGLDLRKAAFECMYTLLETCLERLDIFEFLTHVEDGLKVSRSYDLGILLEFKPTCSWTVGGVRILIHGWGCWPCFTTVMPFFVVNGHRQCNAA